MLDRFCRATLQELGFHRREIRIEMAPSGKGSGKRWVTDRYPREVATIRQKRHQRLAVLVGTDVDELSVRERHNQLSQALAEYGQAERDSGEAIALWLPKWSIETWLLQLTGTDTDESENKKGNVARPDFATAAKEFAFQFRNRSHVSQKPTLPSLEDAFAETANLCS